MSAIAARLLTLFGIKVQSPPKEYKEIEGYRVMLRELEKELDEMQRKERLAAVLEVQTHNATDESR